MNQQTASLGGVMNSFKWAIVFFLIIGGALGYYQISDQSLLVRSIGIFAIAALAIFTAFQTDKGKQLWQFGMASKAELRKVVWPTRQETVQTTVLVMAVVAIVGLILWGVDMVLLKTVAWITGYGGS